MAVLLTLLLALQTPPREAPPRESQVEERVTVERVVVTGRVVDRHAAPIRDLKTADFRLRVDGKDTPIESVDWNPGGRPDAQPRTEEERSSKFFEAPGSQLFVMLFQWELAGQKDKGFIRMMRQALELADRTDP